MLALVLFPVLAGWTLWLLSRWTSLRSLPLYVSIPLFLSVFIPISTVALVPFDLVDDQTLDNKARLLMWRLIYWLSFLLMWAVLPIIQAYVESGFHAPLDRLKDASRYTLKYHLIVLGAGLIGAIYMFISAGVSFTSLKALCVALSHTFGLILVIWMLGHGVVEIPRAAWHGTIESQLSKLYRRATHVHDTYSDSQASYDDVVAKIMALEPIKTANYDEWISGLVDEIRKQDLPLSRAAASRAQPRDLTPMNVASLSRRFHRELGRTMRSRADWSKLLQDVEYYESLRTSNSPFHNKVRPILVRALAVFLAILGSVIVWSEIVCGTRLSLVDLIVKRAPPGLKLLLAMLILGYMCFCVNSSLSSMRIFNLYAIVPHHTDMSSLLFFAAYALRLTVPLSYNFLMLNSTQDTVFQEFLGKFINLTAIGKYVNQILPSLILLPIAMTLFNLYEIVKDYLGFGLGLDYFGDSCDLEAGSTLLAAESEGRELVKRASQGFNNSTLGGANRSSMQPISNEVEPGLTENSLAGRIKSWFT